MSNPNPNEPNGDSIKQTEVEKEIEAALGNFDKQCADAVNEGLIKTIPKKRTIARKSTAKPKDVRDNPCKICGYDKVDLKTQRCPDCGSVDGGPASPDSSWFRRTKQKPAPMPDIPDKTTFIQKVPEGIFPLKPYEIVIDTKEQLTGKVLRDKFIPKHRDIAKKFTYRSHALESNDMIVACPGIMTIYIVENKWKGDAQNSVNNGQLMKELKQLAGWVQQLRNTMSDHGKITIKGILLIAARTKPYPTEKADGRKYMHEPDISIDGLKYCYSKSTDFGIKCFHRETFDEAFKKFVEVMEKGLTIPDVTLPTKVGFDKKGLILSFAEIVDGFSIPAAAFVIEKNHFQNYVDICQRLTEGKLLEDLTEYYLNPLSERKPSEPGVLANKIITALGIGQQGDAN